MTHDSYLQAISQLNLWAKHYYVLDDPIASDEEYDTLYHAVVAYEAQNPSHIAKDSPTQRVGDKILESFEKSTHIKRMWSLDDVFNTNIKKLKKRYPDGFTSENSLHRAENDI